MSEPATPAPVTATKAPAKPSTFASVKADLAAAEMWTSTHVAIVGAICFVAGLVVHYL